MRKQLIAAALLIYMTGCVIQPSPTTQPAVDPVKIAEDTVTAATLTLNTLRIDGKIGDKDWYGTYRPAIDAASAALSAWEAAPNGAQAHDAFFAALPKLLELLVNNQKQSHPAAPTTKAAQ